MTFFFRRSFAVAGLALLCLSISGCFDNEPAERKAFMEFLQVHVLDKPGVHVPKPTDAETKSFGQYAKHYMVITDFTADPEMIAITKDMAEAMQIGAPRSIKELMDRRQDVKTVGETMIRLRAAMDKKLADTEAARAALQQPADLKAIYSAAFDRDVGDPSRAFRNAFPVVEDAFVTIQKLVDFLEAHPGAVTFSGSTVQTSDAKVRAELNTILTAMNTKSQQLQDLQRRMRLVLTGY
jgi:hypothetical protein